MKYNEINSKIKEQLDRDWIITNGIGGYASQSALGVNTRKNHGLLIEPLTPPARRFMILSKVDESIEIDGKKYNLYTNISNNDMSDGFTHLISFKKEYIPIFTYKVAGITIKKFICMQYGRNTVVVLYRVINHDKETRLTLAPIVI
jgi:predicted glycogen debranching enzyme